MLSLFGTVGEGQGGRRLGREVLRREPSPLSVEALLIANAFSPSWNWPFDCYSSLHVEMKKRPKLSRQRIPISGKLAQTVRTIQKQ